MARLWCVPVSRALERRRALSLEAPLPLTDRSTALLARRPLQLTASSDPAAPSGKVARLMRLSNADAGLRTHLLHTHWRAFCNMQASTRGHFADS